MNLLIIKEFGNPILRAQAKQLSVQEIKSQKIQQLIKDIRYTLTEKKLGVGLAAPQVGVGVSLAVISIRPTRHRPTVEPFEMVIINPQITKTFGNRASMWEGCISGGKSYLFGMTKRYKKVEIQFFNDKGEEQVLILDGLPAHVVQHETDHLNGILFMDHVYDSKTYMTMKEYKKMNKAKK